MQRRFFFKVIAAVPEPLNKNNYSHGRTYFGKSIKDLIYQAGRRQLFREKYQYNDDEFSSNSESSNSFKPKFKKKSKLDRSSENQPKVDIIQEILNRRKNRIAKEEQSDGYENSSDQIVNEREVSQEVLERNIRDDSYEDSHFEFEKDHDHDKSSDNEDIARTTETIGVDTTDKDTEKRKKKSKSKLTPEQEAEIKRREEEMIRKEEEKKKREEEKRKAKEEKKRLKEERKKQEEEARRKEEEKRRQKMDEEREFYDLLGGLLPGGPFANDEGEEDDELPGYDRDKSRFLKVDEANNQFTTMIHRNIIRQIKDTNPFDNPDVEEELPQMKILKMDKFSDDIDDNNIRKVERKHIPSRFMSPVDDYDPEREERRRIHHENFINRKRSEPLILPENNSGNIKIDYKPKKRNNIEKQQVLSIASEKPPSQRKYTKKFFETDEEVILRRYGNYVT